jgi:hypothetical protein
VIQALAARSAGVTNPSRPVTIPPPLPALNEGRDFRVAAAPRTGFEQRGEGRDSPPRSALRWPCFVDAPVVGLEQGGGFLASEARRAKRVPLVFAATAARVDVANTTGSCAA